MKRSCCSKVLLSSFLLGIALAFLPATSMAADTKPAVGEVKGKVTQGGKPLAGCRVDAFPQPGGEGGGQATTEKDGTYSIKKVPVGDLYVSVSIPAKDGEATCSQGMSMTLGEKKTAVADFDFAVTDTGAVEGTIRVYGQPTTQGNVSYRPTGGQSRMSWWMSPKGGAFRFDKLPVGAGMLEIQCEGKIGRWLNKSIIVKIDKDQTLRQDVEFSGPGRVTGKVTGIKEGETGVVAVVGGKFQADKLDDAALRRLCAQALGQAAVGPDGAFTFNGIQPGPSTLVAWVVAAEKEAPKRFCLKELEVKDSDSATAELTLP